jgi:hypothetical protein
LGVASFFVEVRSDTAKIPADALLPGEIVAADVKGEHDESTELQWRHKVSILTSEGCLTNCIDMCVPRRGSTPGGSSSSLLL